MSRASLRLTGRPAAPGSKIDYILVRRSDPWQVKEVIIADEPVASDHDPVLVTLQWQGE